MMNVKVGAVYPSVNVNWMLAAVSGELSGCSLLNVEVAEAVFCWGCRFGVRAQVRGGDVEGVSDGIGLESGSDLDVVMRRRLLMCC